MVLARINAPGSGAFTRRSGGSDPGSWESKSYLFVFVLVSEPQLCLRSFVDLESVLTEMFQC